MKPIGTARTTVGRHGRLTVLGNRIVDERAETVVFRGMSLFWSQWQPQYFNANAVRWLRDDWNINLLRAPIAVHHGGYLEHPAREMRKIETVIEAAIDLGIYVVVDWHTHEPERVEAAKFFSAIARKYGRRPNIIYEIWNEPLGKYDWSQDIKPFHESVIPAIRAHDPYNLIVAGTEAWCQRVDKAAADPLHFSNVAYALHFYAGTHGQSLRRKAEIALARGIALVVTEWGTSDATGSGLLDSAETLRWRDFLDANQLSDVNWSIADKNETSAALRPGAAPEGGWPENMISQSGLLVRQRLRTLNPRMS